MDSDQIKAFALEQHRHQVDKAGNPYANHLIAVAYGVAPFGRGIESAAWLHDVVEDTRVSMNYLTVLGVRRPVLEMVDLLTCPRGMDRASYYGRMERNYGALLVKASDIANNSDPARLALLDQATRNRLEHKYARARAAVFPLLDPHDLNGIIRRVAPALNDVLEQR